MGQAEHETAPAATTVGSSTPPPPSDSTHSMRDYLRVLASNRHFRFLWIAEMVDNVGSWLSYVATLELAEQFSGGAGLAISAVTIIRFLPSLVLAPVCGVVADRSNRVRILVVTALLDAVVVAALAAVPLLHQRSGQVALLYALLALQFSAAAFYDPGAPRKALVPVLVPADELHLATTIDSFAWSITGAVGASVGGVVASRLGVAACFLVDALTYLVAAWCARQLPPELGSPDAQAKQLKKHRSGIQALELSAAFGQQLPGEDEAGGAARHAQRRGRPGSRGEARSGTGGSRAAAEEAAENGSHLAGGLTHAEQRHHHELAPGWQAAGSAAEAGAEALPDPELEPLHPPGGGAGSGGSLGTRGSGGSTLAAATSALAEGVQALREGWAYVSSRANREVAAMVLMKCAAATVWGAVDVLNVRFSQMDQFQGLGDSSTTLGLIFAVVGFGCFVGPVALNHIFPPQPQWLRWGVAASYALFFGGLALMLVAPSIALVLISTFIRSMGSAVLWVYSTLLMQQRVPNELLGRISSLESALYTVSESASSVFGGAAFDVLHLSLHQLLVILTTAAGAMAAGWSLYAWLVNRVEARGGRDNGAYAPVRRSEPA